MLFRAVVGLKEDVHFDKNGKRNEQQVKHEHDEASDFRQVELSCPKDNENNCDHWD